LLFKLRVAELGSATAEAQPQGQSPLLEYYVITSAIPHDLVI